MSRGASVIRRLIQRLTARPKVFASVVMSLSFFVGGSLAIWDWQHRRLPPDSAGRLTAPIGQISCITYSRDGRQLAAGTGSGQMLVWDLANEALLPFTQLTKQQITCLATTNDGFLLAGTMGQGLLIWQIKTRKARMAPQLPAEVTSIAVHPKRPELVLGLSNGTLYYLDTKTAKSSQIRKVHPGGVKAVAFDPKGELLVSAGADGKVIFRNGKTQKVEKTLSKHTGEVSCLGFSPNGVYLATGDWDGTAVVWKVDDGSALRVFSHPDDVSSLALTDSLLMTGSWDHQLRFWPLAGETMGDEFDTQSPIQALALSPDQQTVATVSGTDHVQFWKVAK